MLAILIFFPPSENGLTGEKDPGPVTASPTAAVSGSLSDLETRFSFSMTLNRCPLGFLYLPARLAREGHYCWTQPVALICSSSCWRFSSCGKVSWDRCVSLDINEGGASEVVKSRRKGAAGRVSGGEALAGSAIQLLGPLRGTLLRARFGLERLPLGGGSLPQSGGGGDEEAEKGG